MTKDEALKLEALKYAASMGYGRIVREMKIAPFTIKCDEALAQPEQEALISPTCNVVIKTSNQRIEFNADNGFGAWLTNPTKTDNGLTVGERNRAELHGRLDAWMDDFKEKNT